MTLTPLALRSRAVRDALVRRGMDVVHAEAAGRGLAPIAVVFDRITSDHCRLLLQAARRQGVESLTGDDWIVLAGSAARVAGLARPGVGTLPVALAEELGEALQGVVDRPHRWVTARGAIPLDRPVVTGILNVTPDSFSDGGLYLDPDDAVRHASDLVEHGADMLDIGAESTRPGHPKPVSVEEEWRRLAPVLSELTRRFVDIPLSVDTVKAETARRALDVGAWAVNDVSGLRLDPEIAEVCASHEAGMILMHSRGSTAEMASYTHASYHDVVSEVAGALRDAVRLAEEHGVSRDRIVLDPGLGFSKTPEQSYDVLRGISTLTALGFPVMVGPSRKRFLGAVTGDELHARDRATAAACVAAYLLGASFFRVHNAGVVREAVDVAHAIGRE